MNKDSYFSNIFKVSNTKNKLEIISNIAIDKNTFISEAFGYYGYKNPEKNINKIFFFRFKDNSYNRFFYLLNDKTIYNLIISKDTKKEQNIQLKGFLDCDKNVKIVIFTIKKINKGDKFIIN